MNFLLNKIDTDLRRKIYERTRDGKVHRKEQISIYRDSEKGNKKSFEEYIESEAKENKKRKIIVKATRLEEPAIKLNAEKEEKESNLLQGTFLDVKK
ncbi:hypothetical protein JCM1393_01740 [Clostridium carnis]